jgi:hypothetical protein
MLNTFLDQLFSNSKINHLLLGAVGGVIGTKIYSLIKDLYLKIKKEIATRDLYGISCTFYKDYFIAHTFEYSSVKTKYPQKIQNMIDRFGISFLKELTVVFDKTKYGIVFGWLGTNEKVLAKKPLTLINKQAIQGSNAESIT